MIAKVDDSKLNGDDINAMSDGEFKSLENRLRNMAKKHNMNLHKVKHPVDDYYLLADLDARVVADALDVLDLIDSLYKE